MDVAAKIVWITGASSGIGEALAYEFSTKKCHIILTARNEERLEEVKDVCERKGGVCRIIPADLTDSAIIPGLVKEAVQAFGPVNIFINNAGMSQRSLAKDTPIEIDRKMMELNFFSGIHMIKELLPGMIKNGGGHIVAISSVVGKYGFPLRSAYSASKHAMQGFFETLNAELFHENIKTTIVSPGRIKTNISINAITKDGSKYGKMDKGQAKGMDVQKAAKKIIKSIEQEKKELLLGGKEAILVYIRKFLPSLYYYIARTASPT